MVIIVMGVSGTGKTTIGKALAKKLDADFYDADDYHPKENKEKMASRKPLNDEDRKPWLRRLSRLIKNHLETNTTMVLACSALKKKYRNTLHASDPQVTLIFLTADYEVLKSRLQNRDSHFFPAELINSQLETLEKPEDALEIDVSACRETVLENIVNTLLH
ncbi:MAG: gluconokinase [Spirochaetia bacterium]